MIDHDDLKRMYEIACPKFLAETDEEPMLLVMPSECGHAHEDDGYCEDRMISGVLPASAPHMLPVVAVNLSLHTPEHTDYVALAMPLFYFATNDASEVENISHGDLQAAYERGDERVREVVATCIVTGDSVTSQMFVQPLLEPLHDEPLDGGDGDIQNMLRQFYVAANSADPD